MRTNTLRSVGGVAGPAPAFGGVIESAEMMPSRIAKEPARHALGFDQMAELGGTLAQLGSALSEMPRDGERGLDAWVSGYGLGGSVDKDGNAPGFDHRTGGAIAGVDWPVSETTILGVGLGYAYSEIDYDGGNDGNVESFQTSLYGLWRPPAHDGRLVFDGALGAGLSDYRTKRRITLGGLDRTAEGDTEGYSISARAGVSYRIDWQGYRIAPQAGFAYMRLQQNGYTETGANAVNLRVADKTIDSLQGRLGLEVDRAFVAGGTVWTPWGSLGWRHEFADTEQVIDAAFAGVPEAAFQVAGVDTNCDTIELGFGISATLPDGITWYASYIVSLEDSENAHGLFAGVRLNW